MPAYLFGRKKSLHCLKTILVIASDLIVYASYSKYISAVSILKSSVNSIVSSNSDAFVK
jgi:hypothetical protein